MTAIIEPGFSDASTAFADTCFVCHEHFWTSDGKFPYRMRTVRNRASDRAIVDPTQALPGFAPLFTALIVGTRVARPVPITDVNGTVSAVPPDYFDALYEQGVLVRDVSSYPLLYRCLRVSIGLPEENDRCLQALDRALENGLRTQDLGGEATTEEATRAVLANL